MNQDVDEGTMSVEEVNEEEVLEWPNAGSNPCTDGEAFQAHLGGAGDEGDHGSDEADVFTDDEAGDSVFGKDGMCFCEGFFLFFTILHHHDVSFFS